MPRPLSERLLLGLALSGSVVSFWQFALFQADNSFADGVCAAIARPERPPEERAMRLFRWVSSYDDPVPAPRIVGAGAAPHPVNAADAVTPSRGLLTPRVMVEHRGYFRGNCGS